MSDEIKARVEALLSAWIDPYTGCDLVSGKCVASLGIDGHRLALQLRLGYPCGDYASELADAVQARMAGLEGIEQAVVEVNTRIVPHQVQGDLAPLPRVANIIAVASAKGGVGKSTTAVNLALALHADGARVGVLDADLYGPSMPRMLGISGRPDATEDQAIIPMENHGLQVMSMGFLVEADTAVIWRGPMVSQGLQQLLTETAWSDLDYLVVDLPPGTGDIQLTLAQRIPVSGAIIVTTPQEIAVQDAIKGLNMFEKVAVPVLGVVENMSTHVCSACGHEEHIFGQGGAAGMVERFGVTLLGRLPLDRRIREQADGGTPTVCAEPDSPLASRYREMARNTAGRLSLRPRNRTLPKPAVVKR